MHGSKITLLFALTAAGCGPTVAPPPACPDAEKPAPVLEQTGPVPPLLDGHFVVESIQPKGLPAAPPQTYLLGPEERKRCAFVRVVLSFTENMLQLRYAALCVEPEDRKQNPVPLKWCSTQASTYIAWDKKAFELPTPAGSQSNVQRINSYAPGSGPKEGPAERTLWGCKFNLDAQRFDIVERSADGIRLHAPKFDATWMLKATEQPAVDPDDVVAALQGVIHDPAPIDAPPAPN